MSTTLIHVANLLASHPASSLLGGANAELSGRLTDDISRFFDLAGVVANALLGGALARSKKFDPVGFAVLAIASGLGGGALRDVLLGHGPAVFLTDPLYLPVAIAAAAFAYLVRFEGKWWQPTYRWVDAFGVGCWAAVGTQKALAYNIDWFAAIMLGIVTAVGGGIIRDLLLQRTPIVFGGNTLYATAALIASSVLVFFILVLHLAAIGLLVAMALGTTICLLAHVRGWTLPSTGGYAKLPFHL